MNHANQGTFAHRLHRLHRLLFYDIREDTRDTWRLRGIRGDAEGGCSGREKT